MMEDLISFAGKVYRPPYCEGFEPIYATPGRKPNIVVLAEVHSEKKTTAACIERLTENTAGKHRVYIESIQSGQRTPCAQHGLEEKPNRECIGWDSKEEQSKLKDGLAGIRFGIHITDFEKIKLNKQLSDKNFDTFLKDYLAKIEKIQKSSHIKEVAAKSKKIDYTGISQAINWLLTERKGGNTYETIFSKNFKEKIKVRPDTLFQDNLEALSALRSTTLKRNEALINTLSKNPNGIFAVLVAGKAHIIPFKDPGDAGAAEYVQQELKRGENQNPYAILAMTK